MNENLQGKFITIHGIDGTGKTSTATEVVQKLSDSGEHIINYDIHKDTLDNPYGIEKKQVNESGTLEERLAVYLKSMMFHSNEIKSLLLQGFHVVKSRYLDDIEAHFSHLGLSREKIKEIETKFPMVQPDLRVVLVLDENIRRQRINERGALNDRDLEDKKEGSRLKYFEDYLLESMKGKVLNRKLNINTGELNIDQVAEKIVSHLLNDK